MKCHSYKAQGIETFSVEGNCTFPSKLSHSLSTRQSDSGNDSTIIQTFHRAFVEVHNLNRRNKQDGDVALREPAPQGALNGNRREKGAINTLVLL